MTTRVLFTGYAPVHFLCFRPIYRRLEAMAGVELYVSGGLRGATETGYVYDGPAMFRPFGIPAGRILSVEEIQQRPFDLLFSANKRVIAPRDNFGTLVQIFHGVSFRNRGVRSENLNYDFFFLVGPYMARKFAETGLLAAGDPRGVPIGFPKTDPLIAARFDRARLLARHGLDGKRPVVLYAPTGEAHNSLETMGEEVIARLTRTGRYDLLVKPHDHPKNSSIDWFSRLARFRGPRVRLLRESDVIPMLALADLLITDASSVANEYALLDRPIVFLDVPDLFQASLEAGAALDLQTWGRRGGVTVERPEEVVEAVATSLAAPRRLSGVRRALADDLFFNPGRATQAATSWIAGRLLGEGKPRPRAGSHGNGTGGPAKTGARRAVGSNGGRTAKRQKLIGYYLRHPGNLHYFASIKPYLDAFRALDRVRSAIIVRTRDAEHEMDPAYRRYRELITTNCNLDQYDLILTPTFLRPEERASNTRAVQIFHGMSDKPFTYERDFSNYELALCAGQRQVDRLLSHKVNGSIRWLTVGYPKFDNPPTMPPIFDNDRKTVIYCPTWRKEGLSSVDLFLDNPDVAREITNAYNVIVKPHPNLFNPARDYYDPTTIERISRMPGIKLVNSGNVMSWFAQADIYVGDISATGYEWLYFGRPMVFLNPQPGHLRASADAGALTYLWQCGEVCDDIRDLKPMIDRCLAADSFHEQREAILGYSVFRPRDNGATGRAVRAVEGLLNC